MRGSRPAGGEGAERFLFARDPGEGLSLVAVIYIGRNGVMDGSHDPGGRFHAQPSSRFERVAIGGALNPSSPLAQRGESPSLLYLALLGQESLGRCFLHGRGSKERTWTLPMLWGGGNGVLEHNIHDRGKGNRPHPTMRRNRRDSATRGVGVKKNFLPLALKKGGGGGGGGGGGRGEEEGGAA